MNESFFLLRGENILTEIGSFFFTLRGKYVGNIIIIDRTETQLNFLLDGHYKLR